MNKDSIGKNIWIDIIFWGIWLLPATICIYIIEEYGLIILRKIGAQINIKSPTDILIFYSGIGATIAGVLLAVIALVLTLNGQVKFAIFKANGWFKLFINFCFANSMVFVLCSFCSVVGLYGIFPLKFSTYLFIFGLWGLPLIGFIARNLLMDTTTTNSLIDAYLERISSQLDSIFHVVSKHQSDDDK